METERRTFMATVLGNALQKSKEKQTPSVAIRLRTKYDVEKPETPVRMNLIANLWLTYKCMKQTIKTLQEAFNWKGHNITDFNEPILSGKECQVVCDREEWEGQERWSVSFINRAGGLRKMDDTELSDLIKDVQPMVDDMVGERTEIARDEAMPGAIGDPDKVHPSQEAMKSDFNEEPTEPVPTADIDDEEMPF